MPQSQPVSAQRRKQRRLVMTALLAVIGGVGAWQAYTYIASAPQRAEALVQAGIRNLSPGRYPQAVQQFTDALSIDASSWNAYFQRAIANQGLGKLDAAIEDYQSALQLNPNLVEAAVARASIFADKGDVRRSVDELTKVIDRQPTVEAHYRRGDGYAAMKQYDKAIDDFTWVIEQMRDAPYVYFARANAKRSLGDTAGAVEDERMADSFDRGKTNLQDELNVNKSAAQQPVVQQ